MQRLSLQAQMAILDGRHQPTRVRKVLALMLVQRLDRMRINRPCTAAGAHATA